MKGEGQETGRFTGCWASRDGLSLKAGASQPESAVVWRSADVLKQAALEDEARMNTMLERVGKVVRQTKARVFGGSTRMRKASC